MRTFVLLGVMAVLLSGCGEASPETVPKEEAGSPAPTQVTDNGLRVTETLASGLTTPWGLTFLPDGAALVSERDTATVMRVTPEGEVTKVGTVPGVAGASGTKEGGLLGLAYREQMLYAYVTTAEDNRIIAMSYPAEGGPSAELGAPEVIFTGIPMANIHDGGRILFGPDGYLYITTGDAEDPESAQVKDYLGGKILRITAEGEPAPGNPFKGSPVWSLGHRNPQGLAFDPDGRLWATEFGQDAWDELNLIKPGENYGWPDIEGMSDADGDQAGSGDMGEGGRFTDPKAVWTPAEASPSGLVYADGALWMVGVRGGNLWRIELDGEQVSGEPESYLTAKYGRLRTVGAAPDGSLWLTTSNTDGNGELYRKPDDDKILRVELP